MVRNEADVIELFVRHNLGFVDQMIIVDHLSIDATREILHALKTEGAPIEIVKETNPIFTQGATLTREMKRAVGEHGADWIIPLDADEFLGSDNGDVRTIFEGLSPEKPYQVPWRTYVPRAEDALDDPFLFARIPYRRKIEPEITYKALIPRSIALMEGASLLAGSHSVRDRSGRKSRKLEASDPAGLFLAHFPARSCNQLTEKVLILSLSYIAAARKNSQSGWHYRDMFKNIQDEGGIPPEDLAEYGRAYALPENLRDAPQEFLKDPLASSVSASELRYSDKAEVNPLAALTQAAEDLAQRLAAERNKTLWERILEKIKR